MNITGERVVLRAVEEEDNGVLLSLINDPETERMTGGYSYPVSRKGQREWFQSLGEGQDTLRCVIALRENPKKAAGTVILSQIDMKNGTAQLHIKLGEDVRGRGYGRDAVKAAAGYAFEELRLNCIYAVILEYNAPSRKLFESCGFSQEGRLKSRVFKGGGYIDAYSYSLLRSEWVKGETGR